MKTRRGQQGLFSLAAVSQKSGETHSAGNQPLAMEVLASKGTGGHTEILPASAERLDDLLWSVWQKYHPKRTVSLRQAPESLGQGEVQAVEDADTGRAKDKPVKENESELVSPLERHLRDSEMLGRKSRMKREFHVRFCEGPKGRFLWPTRPHRK